MSKFTFAKPETKRQAQPSKSRPPSSNVDKHQEDQSLQHYGDLSLSQSEILDIQRMHGNRAVLRRLQPGIQQHSTKGNVQRFEGAEHRQLGELGSGNATTNINIGTDATPQMLTYGEMVGIAGDWFESLDQIKQLAASQDGRDQIRWALWKDMGGGSGEPAVSQPNKDAVMDRFFNLAAKNVSHFSAGGAANNAYEDYHKRACQKAFEAGTQGNQATFAEARTIEAFGDHFLTDMFSAGHIRTPRGSIQTWYVGKFPNAIDQFITYMAAHMRTFLKANHGVLDTLGQIPDQASIENDVRALGGSAVRAYSLGDIVSLAAHNYDNTHGLNVASDVDSAGSAGPSQWTSFGDNNLSKSATTRDMAVAAVKASLHDLDNMRQAGANAQKGAAGGNPMDVFPQELGNLAPASIPGRPNVPFMAERFVPHEDTAKGNTALVWEWGKMNAEMVKAVDDAVKHDVADALDEKAKALPSSSTKEKLKKDALNDLVSHFRSAGITAIESAIGGVKAAGTPAAAGSGGTP